MEVIGFYLLKDISIQSKRFWNKKDPLCLGNILKDFKANKMKETGLNGHVYQCNLDQIWSSNFPWWSYRATRWRNKNYNNNILWQKYNL